MLNNLWQWLVGNGTGAANQNPAAGANPNVPTKKESPLSPLVEQWRQAGSSAGSIAREAAGLVPNRSLQGAAQGTITAASGAGLFVAGAATANPLLAGAGISALIQGATEAGKSLTNLGKETREQSQQYNALNATIARANAVFDYHQTVRDIAFARSTEASFSSAIEGYDAFLEATKEFRALATGIPAAMTGAGLKFGAGATEILSMFAKRAGLDPALFLRGIEFFAGGGGKETSLLTTLREIEAEGERRRLGDRLKSLEEDRREERRHREEIRPKPSLDPPMRELWIRPGL